MSEQSHTLTGVRDAVHQLGQRMDARFEAIDRRFEALDAKVSRQFAWVVGIQVTTLVAITAALLARA